MYSIRNVIVNIYTSFYDFLKNSTNAIFRCGIVSD